jgi:hypothetical protein
MTQVITARSKGGKDARHYINFSSWHIDFNDKKMGPNEVIQGLYDDLSTVLIGSLVQHSEDPSFHDLKSLYIRMLNGVKENVFQVSRDITDELRDEDPELFDI